MKNLNKGFTLAEVLITLTIIGIIAALTLPALKLAVDKGSWASGLSVAVKNITSGFDNMKAAEMVDNVQDTGLWENYVTSEVTTGNNNIRKELSKYFEIEKMSNGVPSGVEVVDFNNTASSELADTVRFYLTNKSTMNIVFRPYVENANCETIKDNGGNLCEKIADVYIDVNGDKHPNTFGKDIYLFYMSSKGRLYPYGGADVNYYDNSAPLWNSANGCQGDASNIKSGKACTARVVEQGFRISY